MNPILPAAIIAAALVIAAALIRWLALPGGQDEQPPVDEETRQFEQTRRRLCRDPLFRARTNVRIAAILAGVHRIHKTQT